VSDTHRADRPSQPPLRDDGLPTLPTGEPVLHRWFVVALLLLAPVAAAHQLSHAALKQRMVRARQRLAPQLATFRRCA
jgi:predicted RNA polymerase sigma factor